MDTVSTASTASGDSQAPLSSGRLRNKDIYAFTEETAGDSPLGCGCGLPCIYSSAERTRSVRFCSGNGDGDGGGEGGC